MVTSKEDHVGTIIEILVGIFRILIEGEAGIHTYPTAGGVGGGLDVESLQSRHRREETKEADGN